MPASSVNTRILKDARCLKVKPSNELLMLWACLKVWSPKCSRLGISPYQITQGYSQLWLGQGAALGAGPTSAGSKGRALGWRTSCSNQEVNACAAALVPVPSGAIR